LASTSLGVEFLIKEVNAVKKEAESTGQISFASEVTLRACAGLTDDLPQYCQWNNWINKTESAATAAKRAQREQCGGTGQTEGTKPEKANRVQSADQREAEEERDEAGRTYMLVSMIELVARPLAYRKKVLESIERWHEKSRVAAAVLPADSTCDRFARAETAYDRRFYRALGALLAMKQAKDASKILPG
jgi:hypothetical protein